MGVGIFFDSDLHGSIYNSENISEDERANGLLGKWRWSHKHLKAAFNSGILHIVCAFTIYIGLLELEFMSIRIREACFERIYWTNWIARCICWLIVSSITLKKWCNFKKKKKRLCVNSSFSTILNVFSCIYLMISHSNL